MERSLTAILAADVAGDGRATAADEAGTRNALRTHREVVERLVGAHRGLLLKIDGGSCLAEFPGAVEAINCAVDIQQEIEERNEAAAKDQRVELRIGLHAGSAAAEGGTPYGDLVAVATSLRTLAEPGGICVSREVHDQVRHKVGVAFEYAGRHHAGTLAELVPAYRVPLGASAAAPRLIRWWHAIRHPRRRRP
jgi:class 3 adenylate cyclase